jgi:alpha-L-fucosidase
MIEIGVDFGGTKIEAAARVTLLAIILSVTAASRADVPAQAAHEPESYTPAPENLAARQWFQDAKFGVFLHWGLYSELGGGGKMGIAEWIMDDAQIPARSYERLARLFNPTAFNADAWVNTFKAAGARYIVITAKHHEGFAMFGSKVSPYNIVDATPFKRDPLAELAAACRKSEVPGCFETDAPLLYRSVPVVSS